MLAAGCGSSSGGSSSSNPALSSATSAISSAVSSGVSSAADGHVVEIDVADSGLAYVKTSATASAGPVVIRSMNPQSLGHDMKAGTYTFFCSVPGHEDAGMKGTLTVS